jgi:hypothetical protein
LNDTFKVGLYEIVITDVTIGIEDEHKLKPTRIDLRLADSEAETELAAQEAA